MTTPNIEELLKRAKRLRNDLDESNARLDQKCVTAMYEMEQAMQSQAVRIKELEAQLVEIAKVEDVERERDTLRAQLAALQVDDELPEPVGCGYVVKWSTGDTPSLYVEGYANVIGADVYTAYQLRQAQAKVRAKMVPLEKDAARYRWLRERYTAVNFDWEESGQQAVIFTADDFPIASASCDETIDAAMGITGEPK